MYQPPSPIERMSPARFAEFVAGLSAKPDVDNVFEILSNLKGQEGYRPSRFTLKRFIFHKFMILPAAAWAACIVTALMRAKDAPADQGSFAARAGGELTHITVASAVVTPLPIVFALTAVLLMALRASIRDKDPELLEIRSIAANTVTRMALDARYLHEPFADPERAQLRKLLKGKGYDAEQALARLLSNEGEAAEPDPDFQPERRRDS